MLLCGKDKEMGQEAETVSQSNWVARAIFQLSLIQHSSGGVLNLELQGVHKAQMESPVLRHCKSLSVRLWPSGQDTEGIAIQDRHSPVFMSSQSHTRDSGKCHSVQSQVCPPFRGFPHMVTVHRSALNVDVRAREGFRSHVP